MKVKVTIHLAHSNMTPEFILNVNDIQEVKDRLESLMSHTRIVGANGPSPWIVNTDYVIFMTWTSLDEE